MLRVKSLLSSATSSRRGRSADRSVSKTLSVSPHSRTGSDLVIAQSSGDPEKPRVPVFDELQKHRIRVTWAVIEAELGHVGILHFSSLLEHKLEFKMCFDKLKSMDAEELRCSPLVQMHGMSILHVLEQLINRLDDTKSWDDIIAQLARRHVGLNAKPRLARDVAAYCWNSIESVLKQRGHYDREVQELWLTIICWLASAMEYGLCSVANSGQTKQ